MAAVVLSLPSVLTPVVAVVAATFVALDPIRLFWTRPTKAQASTAVLKAQGQSRPAA